MNDSRTDRELAAAHLSGDRSALAGIYDRYANSLYDTAAAMLRDRHEASDVMHDVFLVAAERMDQLREPERLKAWLFAILRNEVYRRTKRRGRSRPTDFTATGGPEVPAPTDTAAEGEGVAYEQLAEMVRGAASGLDERDQLVLELSVRQGLTGADLADALGVSADQSYMLVHRMRERVERSLGALTVARMGKKACPELAGVLTGWDGTFNVLVRKRVARHVDACATCESTKRRYAVLPLLGAAPALAAPIELRESVLGLARRAKAGDGDGYGFDAANGFPSPLGRGRGPKVLITAAAASLVLLLGASVAVLSEGRDDSPVAAESQQATTTPAVPSATSTTLEVATTDIGALDSIVPTSELPPRTDALGDPSHTGVTNPPSTPAPITGAKPPATGVPNPPPTPPPTPIGPTATTRPPTTTRPPSTTTPATATTDVGGAGPTTPPTPPPTPPPTTAPPTTPPTVASTAPPSVASTAPPTVPTTGPPTTAAPATTAAPLTPGNVGLSTRTVDIGATARVAALTITNTGQQPVTWGLTGGAAPFAANGAGGTLAGGQTATVQFTMDRSGKEGDYVSTYNVTSSSLGGGAVQVRGRIEVAPVVAALRTISELRCTWTNSNMSVTVTDESTISSVTLSWNLGGGSAGSTAMSPGGGASGWIGALGVQQINGTWSWTVTATDARGNRGTLSGSTIVSNC